MSRLRRYANHRSAGVGEADEKVGEAHPNPIKYFFCASLTDRERLREKKNISVYQ